MAKDSDHRHGVVFSDLRELDDRELVLGQRQATSLPTGIEIRVLEIEMRVLFVSDRGLDLTLGQRQRSEQLVVRCWSRCYGVVDRCLEPLDLALPGARR